MVESVMPFVRRIIKYVFVLTLKLRERTFNKRIKYLFFNRHSSVLAVVFSGMDTFDNKRLYNYVRGLSNVPVDFLYLSDPFGFRGSYYWKENGGDEPFRQTQSLINKVIDRGGYRCVCFLGSSKGGSAAIIHGASIGVNYILAASNQFNIGSFVAQFPEIFSGMTGKSVNFQTELELNQEFKEIFKTIPSKTQLRILYSDKEPTYNEHTKDMLSLIKENNINCHETKCDFRLHGDTGAYFKPWAAEFLLKIKAIYDNDEINNNI